MINCVSIRSVVCCPHSSYILPKKLFTYNFNFKGDLGTVHVSIFLMILRIIKTDSSILHISWT